MASSFPAEIWHMIATNFIISSTTLQNLRLVCRHFNSIFTPYFFNKVTLVEKHQYSGVLELPLQRLGSLSQGRCLNFIESLKLPHRVHKAEHWAALGKLLNKATGLKECIVSCEPCDMVRFGVNVNDVYICNDVGNPRINDLTYWQPIPHYRHLRHLTLFSMPTGLHSLGNDIARVLAESLSLKTLGLAFNNDDPDYGHIACDLLSQITHYFVCYRDDATIRLKIEDLKLGYRVYDPHAVGYDAKALSRLTNLKKLRTFSHLNQTTPGERGNEDFVYNLNYESLFEATNLTSVSAYFCTRGLAALVANLSRLQPRKLRDIKIHIVDTKWRRAWSFEPFENLGGGWQKIHVGGTTSVHKGQRYEELFRTFISQSYDTLEDLGLYSSSGIRLEREICKYTNLRRLFVVQDYAYLYHSATNNPHIQSANFARNLFSKHRKAMQELGFQSQLKYIGLGIHRTVYTITWVNPTSGLESLTHNLVPHPNEMVQSENVDVYQIIALSPEEAETFQAFVPKQL